MGPKRLGLISSYLTHHVRRVGHFFQASTALRIKGPQTVIPGQVSSFEGLQEVPTWLKYALNIIEPTHLRLPHVNMPYPTRRHLEDGQPRALASGSRLLALKRNKSYRKKRADQKRLLHSLHKGVCFMLVDGEQPSKSLVSRFPTCFTCRNQPLGGKPLNSVQQPQRKKCCRWKCAGSLPKSFSGAGSRQRRVTSCPVDHVSTGGKPTFGWAYQHV